MIKHIPSKPKIFPPKELCLTFLMQPWHHFTWTNAEKGWISYFKRTSSLKGAVYEIENYPKYHNYFNNRCNVIIVHIFLGI